ncbi:MAG: DUF3419 family protein [Candidatus Magnetoovum sp. WYHC-5]|nr:DUF3419 family protein [Candidatus Magnetoovum sp. WYHC-5]
MDKKNKNMLSWLHQGVSFLFIHMRGDTHGERMESLYKKQAKYYDHSRQKLLLGRKPMLKAVSKYMGEFCKTRVWVDIGGGTGENILKMAEFLDISWFKHIYVVDISPSMCKEAQRAMTQFPNVTVCCEEASKFRPSEKVGLVTFSYSLSMITDTFNVVDSVLSYLADDGVVAICDFGVSSKNDVFYRKHSYLKRWFWPAWFDFHGVDLTPSKRQYLEYKLTLIEEHYNTGSIPWIPFSKVPFYFFIGVPKDTTLQRATLVHPYNIEINTSSVVPSGVNDLLYTYTIEDPETDNKWMDFTPKPDKHHILLLTSGGDNVLKWVADERFDSVTCVDLNMNQNFLLEWKIACLQAFDKDTVWQLLGLGRHKDIDTIWNTISTELSPGAQFFWKTRLQFFKEGLYFQGNYGYFIKIMIFIAKLAGLYNVIQKQIETPSQQNLNRIRNSLVVRMLLNWKWYILEKPILWTLMGIPKKQIEHIYQNQTLSEYVQNVMIGMIEHLSWNDNYFIKVLLSGEFAPSCHPPYLNDECLIRFKDDKVWKRLTILCDYFVNALNKKKYTRVIMSDHLDWLDKDGLHQSALALKNALTKDGIASLRSAALEPAYISIFEQHGFQCTRVAIHKPVMDRLNSYASYYILKIKD